VSRRLPLGADDLPEGGMRGVALPGDRYVLLARVGGVLHAIEDVCNHGGCLLSEGKLKGTRVTCPCHDMAFDVRTGALATEPRLCDDQRRYGRVVVEGGKVWVEVDP